jgi:hypothetical protein
VVVNDVHGRNMRDYVAPFSTSPATSSKPTIYETVLQLVRERNVDAGVVMPPIQRTP